MQTGERLTILVLHRMGDPRSWRTAVRDLELILPTCAPGHDYIVHAAELPLPEYVKALPFHGIVLGPTFLCARYEPDVLARVMRDYDFIRSSDAFKIALPQDVYDCSAILDRWMVDWKIDRVYSPHGADTWPVLFPNYSATDRIRHGFTGYVSDAWISAWRAPKPFASRAIDVSYRARQLPPQFGRIGHLKDVIGERFEARARGTGLRLDISTDPARAIAGAAWHTFLEDSKFCLATISGSSLLDPEGAIRSCVRAYLARRPQATFEDVEAHCFKGEDGRHTFMALGPRHLEAALAGTVQIATPGEYGIFEAGVHYIPLAADCSNAPEVFGVLRDRTTVASMASAAKAAVLDRQELRAAQHAADMIGQIQAGAAAKHTPRAIPGEIRSVIERYRSDVERHIERLWARRRRMQRLRAAAVALGARRIKRFFSTGTS